MKTLIVEDDEICHILLKKILAKFGECIVAVNGDEAIKSFISAHDNKVPFDLICLDIMMPLMDGHEVLKRIRKWEMEHDIHGLDGVKIIMSTALDDNETIMKSFRSQCEAYMVKPIDKDKLLNEIHLLGLLQSEKQ